MKKFLIYYFFFSFSFLTLFSSGFVDSQDGFQYLAVARRIYYDHTLEMPKERFMETDEIPQNIHMSYVIGQNGKYYSATGLGYSLALIPAVAGEDIFLRLSNNKPISAFPLQNDWPVLLFASFTNAFFGALLIIVLYLYLRSFGISNQKSALLSFLSIIGTNLFPYTKHTFAHMMFISFLTLSFYLIRRYSLTKNPFNILISGITFGIVLISYNQTYIFAIIPLVAYYLLLSRNHNLSTFRIKMRDVLLFLSGLVPFYLINYGFDLIRSSQANALPLSGSDLKIILFPRVYIIFEGIWNLIISPGRGFLIYSPILLMLLLFWFKLSKKLLPEIISYSLLAIIYIYFIGTLRGGGNGPEFLVWHGESSWGPRYVTPLLPFAMILISNIYNNISSSIKLAIFYPLITIRLIIQLLGMILPYQIKFGGLEYDLHLNGDYFDRNQYANEIPRYSPILSMSRILYKRFIDIDKQYNHGIYNLRLYDGFEFPFFVGYTKWRGILPNAYLSFDNNRPLPIHSLELQIRNHQIDPESSYSATLSFFLNGTSQSILSIPVNKENNIKITVPSSLLKENNNILSINTNYIGTNSSFLKKKQVLFLQILKINDLPQNLETIDYPYISVISQKMGNINYQYWGNKDISPWSVWDIHSGVYEQTFDLWWLRPLHYWDLPKKLFIGLFLIDLAGIFYFGLKILKYFKILLKV